MLDRHVGIMLVGGTGTGKTEVLRTLLTSVHLLKKTKFIMRTIDPKTIDLESLYGVLDYTTREWQDGLFTKLLRKVINDAKGEQEETSYIVFDGEVDPVWVENLNS